MKYIFRATVRAIGYSCVETILLWWLQLITFKVEFPYKDITHSISRYASASILDITLHDSLFFLTARLVTLNVPLNALVILALMNNKLLYRNSIVVAIIINSSTFLFIGGILALVAPFTRDLWFIERPIYSHLFIYGTLAACVISPVICNRVLLLAISVRNIGMRNSRASNVL